MKTVFVFLIDGFEEIEAVGTVDILRRGGQEVKTVSLTGKKPVRGAHNITLEADTIFEQTDFSAARMLIVPGGTIAYYEHEELKKLIAGHHARGGTTAAICAAPAVLAAAGILDGRRATCYPGFEKYLGNAILETGEAVVVDGNVVTGKGPGLTLQFALALVGILAGEAVRRDVAEGLLVE